MVSLPIAFWIMCIVSPFLGLIKSIHKSAHSLFLHFEREAGSFTINLFKLCINTKKPCNNLSSIELKSLIQWLNIPLVKEKKWLVIGVIGVFLIIILSNSSFNLLTISSVLTLSLLLLFLSVRLVRSWPLSQHNNNLKSIENNSAYSISILYVDFFLILKHNAFLSPSKLVSLLKSDPIILLSLNATLAKPVILP